MADELARAKVHLGPKPRRPSQLLDHIATREVDNHSERAERVGLLELSLELEDELLELFLSHELGFTAESVGQRGQMHGDMTRLIDGALEVLGRSQPGMVEDRDRIDIARQPEELEQTKLGGAILLLSLEREQELALDQLLEVIELDGHPYLFDQRGKRLE